MFSGKILISFSNNLLVHCRYVYRFSRLTLYCSLLSWNLFMLIPACVHFYSSLVGTLKRFLILSRTLVKVSLFTTETLIASPLATLWKHGFYELTFLFTDLLRFVYLYQNLGIGRYSLLISDHPSNSKHGVGVTFRQNSHWL